MSKIDKARNENNLCRGGNGKASILNLPLRRSRKHRIFLWKYYCNFLLNSIITGNFLITTCFTYSRFYKSIYSKFFTSRNAYKSSATAFSFQQGSFTQRFRVNLRVVIRSEMKWLVPELSTAHNWFTLQKRKRSYVEKFRWQTLPVLSQVDMR